MALPFFSKKRERILGVDIGTSSIKIVELTRIRGEKLKLTNYVEFSSSIESALQSTSIRLSSKEAAEIIKNIIQKAGMEEKSAAMSIPVFSGFSTVISLPKMSDQELEQAVMYEAKKYIPLPLGEVKFEWVQLDGDKGQETRDKKRWTGDGGNQSSAGRIRVLIVAVTSELINRYQEIAKLSGLNLAYLELDSFSLARSFSVDSALIIDIGSRDTTLSIVDNGWPVFSRTVDVSGYELSKLLSSSLGIDFARAEEFKKKQGINAGSEVILPLLDSVFVEGNRVIDEYKKSAAIDGGNTVIKKVILSGGTAKMFGILEYASKSMGMEVVMGFPFNDIMYPKELESTLRDIGPSFGVAVGLALREFK